MSSARQIALGVAGAVIAVLGSILTVHWISVDREPALWAVDGDVGESSLAIPIRAAHAGCPSWAGLGGLVVHATETETEVVVTATFPAHDPDTPCDDEGRSMGTKVKLDAPLGDRALIDGATGLDPTTPNSLALHTGETLDDE